MIIQREIYPKIKPYLFSKEAVVITGMRRTGKTTLLQSIYDDVSTANKLFIDLENPLNQKFFEETDYEKIKFNLEVQGLAFGQKAFVFLDEIQFIKNLPQIVKYLSDHYPVKFFLTGSSSFYLKNLFSESLSGRKYIFELFPFNFQEFILSKGEKINFPEEKKSISETIYNLLSRYYEEYLKFGGFPGVIAKKTFAEKKMALSDIFSSYFQLEVQQFSDYRKTTVLRDLILLLMQRVGSKIDITKLAAELGVSRPTIYDYLGFLENTYFIKLIKPFSRSQDATIRGAEKVYFCDTGLLNNMSKPSDGAILENNIFQLLRPQGEINYYQTKSGAEIDFILDKKIAYEAKTQPTTQDLKRLIKISRQLKIKECYIISQKFSILPKIKYGFNL